MPPPVKKRTSKSYARDIEALARLRTSLLLDRSIPKAGADTAIADIDRLTTSLADLIPHIEDEREAAGAA